MTEQDGSLQVASRMRFRGLAATTLVASLALAGCGGGGGGDGGGPEDEAGTASALTKQRAIMAEAGQATDAGLGGSAADGSAVATYRLAISRPSRGTTVEITDSAMTGEGDPAFVHAMNLGVTGRMLVRDNGMGVEEVAVVHSDIEAIVATPFAEVHELDLSTDTTNDTPDPTHEALLIDGTDTAVLGRVMSASFTAGAAGNLDFDHDDASTADVDEASEVAGTYDGAMGTFRCNGDAGCTVTLDANGGITAMSAGWIFTPDRGATIDVADDDYLHYGFWLKKTTDDEGAVTYDEVETFAGSSVPESGDVSQVMGRATYEGSAAGVYVIRLRYDPNTGELVNASSGRFTADASLAVTFGQTVAQDIAPNQLNRLTGTIDSFTLSGGEANDWSVMLAGVIDPAAGTASGTAEGGLMGEAGSFGATFHGPTTDESGEPVPPHTVVGEFNASFRNGSVAGAFGAREP